MATNHGSIEFLRFPNPQYPGDDTTLIKKWLRDSWARRKIVALQQAIAAIVVPTKTSQLTNDSGFITQADIPPGSTASSTTPKMDGTASVGTETAYARGDHRHPTDTSRQAALSSSQMAAVNSGITAAKVAEYDAIEVPTKTSDLTNDSGFVTASAVPTATSDLTNDNGFVTASDIPTKTSELTNDSGFITSYTETDPTVPAWAKASTKPSYTAAEVGALPDSTVIPSKTSQLTNDSGFITSAPVTSVNGKTGAVNLTASDVGALPSSTAIPSKTSDLTNDSGYITASALPSVPSASTTNPAMDGTASAGSSGTWSRGDHVHPHDTSKADKATTLSGYGITDAYTKTEVDALIPTVPTKTSDLTNDSGFISLSTLRPTSYAAFTPYQSRCTIDAGGYIKIGNIVFIDMVITVLQAAGTSAFVAMLSDVSAIKPLKGANYSILTAVNNTSRTKTTKVLVNTNGGISLCNAAVNEVVYITGCYLAA